MLASLPHELTKDLAGVGIDRDPVGFVDDDDQPPVISAEGGKHSCEHDGECSRQIGRVSERELPQTDRDWSGADAKCGRTVETLARSPG